MKDYTTDRDDFNRRYSTQSREQPSRPPRHRLTYSGLKKGIAVTIGALGIAASAWIAYAGLFGSPEQKKAVGIVATSIAGPHQSPSRDDRYVEITCATPRRYFIPAPHSVTTEQYDVTDIICPLEKTVNDGLRR